MLRLIMIVCVIGVVPTTSMAVVPPIPHLPETVLQKAASLAQMPTGETESATDPIRLAERIAANSRQVGERLAAEDTGEQTRGRQNEIIKDIDKLLNLAENPPPSGSANNRPMNPNSSVNNSGKSESSGGPSGPGSPGRTASQPGGSSPSGNNRSTQGNRGRSGWRDRAQQQGEALSRKQPMPSSAKPEGSQSAPSGNQTANDKPSAAQPDGGTPGTARVTPTLPDDVPFSKQVWGHLPEQMRQQMTQYYREQFVSKYGDLLRQYYSSLSERNKPANNR